VSVTFATGVLLATAVWHALAAWHFTLFPARTLARATSERPVQPIPTELFRFLGGLNLALVLLAALAAFAGPEGRRLAFATLALANLSQAIVDARIKRMGLAHGAFFLQIFVGDALFTAANAVGLLLELR
jgi:hypothetical protein